MGDANGGPGQYGGGGYGGYNGGGFGGYGGNGGGYGGGGPRYQVTGNDQSGYSYASGVSPFDRGQPGGNLGRQSGSPYDQQGSQNAQNLWNQYQGAQPGQGRDDLIRQMQAGDNGAAFNANMKNGGWVRTDSPGGNYSYSQPGGVSDQVQRMQDAQGLNRQGQPQTQQWSSQGNQGGGYGGYQPGAFHSWNGGSNEPMRERGYGQGGGWGGGQGGGQPK